jgi:hypothetical protein
MGSQEHRRILSRGVRFWNQWRQENPEVVPDLSFCVLEDANLAGIDLSRADLYCASLEWTDLTGASFDGADLCGADLSGANVSNTGLGGGLGLTQTQINEADGDRRTGLPEGLRLPERWLTQPPTRSKRAHPAERSPVPV